MIHRGLAMGVLPKVSCYGNTIFLVVNYIGVNKGRDGENTEIWVEKSWSNLNIVT